MKKALNIALNIVLWLLVVVAALTMILVLTSRNNDGVANIFGYMTMSVQTDSMAPEFYAGDLLIDKKVDDIGKLKAGEKDGDIITFWTLIEGKRALNTHRIISIESINGQYYNIKTKGDANDIADTTDVKSADVVGIYTGTKLPGFGKALDYIQTKTGFFVCILIPIILFFMYALFKFVMTVSRYKKENTPVSISSEDEERIKQKAIEEYLAKQKQETENKAEDVEVKPSGEDAAKEASGEDTEEKSSDENA